MKVLILGGTRFLGRHIVECLAAATHRVVCFHRGQTACTLPDGVEERLGDRNFDLSPVETERWDAVVDTSGYRPEQLARSLELRTDRYLFISTVNVYSDLSIAGIGENAPTIEVFEPSDEAAAYGGNKAACERLVIERSSQRATIFRPGLIAGRWDHTGRFTYWCERLLHGGEVLAPGPPGRRIQLIDAADIARFAERVLAHEIGGIFNVVGPKAALTMESMLRECADVAAERGAPASQIVWTDGAFLLQRGVEPWSELPLWLTDPAYAGVLEIANEKALASGLRLRSIAETIRSALASTTAEGESSQAGMASEREAELLAAWRGCR